MDVTQIIQYVARKGTVASTNLVDDEILIREVLEEVFRDNTLGDGLTVPRLREAVSFS